MEPTKYSKRQLNLQLQNTYIAVHDLACGCNDPTKHILLQLTSGNIDTSLQPSTIEKIRCLLTEDGGGDASNQLVAATTDDIGINEGELEELFKEDTDPDDAG